MSEKPRSVMRSVWKRFGEGLMWTGFAWNGMHPPGASEESAALPADQPCLPQLSEAEPGRSAAPVEQLR